MVGGAGEFSIADAASQPWLARFIDFCGELAARRIPTFASCFGLDPAHPSVGLPRGVRLRRSTRGVRSPAVVRFRADGVMKSQPLLLEIGCEEIPARMIRRAAADLAGRVIGILERGGLSHGQDSVWAGPRRLAVHIEAVAGRQQDRDELLIGPPASVAFDEAGRPTKAALGFAKKQGVDAADLERRKLDKGEYLVVERRVSGRSVGELLADELPRALARKVACISCSIATSRTVRLNKKTWSASSMASPCMKLISNCAGPISCDNESIRMPCASQ